MKRYGLILFSLTLILNSLVTWAQTQPCGTDEAHQRLLVINPDYAKAVEKNQAEYAAFLKNPMPSSRSIGCNEVAPRRVPVVVHVVHLDEPIGTGSNISDAQVIGAIDGLNERWQAIIGDGADMGFEFCLARRSPAGTPTSGIVRVSGASVPGFAADGISWNGGAGADEAAVKALSTWPQANYYNIWVVHTIGGGVGGYAYFPNGGPLDGTVIRSGAMTYNSTTLTHELGHGFNLAHTFQGDNDNTSCPPNDDCTVDGDGVCDTPPHKEGDCGGTNPCPGGGIWENSRRNYMSYCGGTTRMTDGQGVRVNAASYGGARVTLFSSEGCIPANLPDEAGILSIVFPNNQPLCEDTFSPVIRIKNYGSAPLTTLSIEAWIDGVLFNTTMWSGNLATNAATNITLNPLTVTVGPHDIEYRLVNVNGNGLDTYVENNDICAFAYYEPIVTTIPSCWDFEAGEIPGSWTTNGPIITTGIHNNPGCTDQGDHCLVFNSFQINAGGNGTQTITTVVPFDLSGLPGAALNFDVAKRRNYLVDRISTLEILVSEDCGQNYKAVYRRNDALSNFTEPLETVSPPAQAPTVPWVPTQCSHWRRDVADLSEFAGKEVLVAFRYSIDKNNSENLYIDNICVKSCDGFAEIEALNGPDICALDTAHFQVNTGPGFKYIWFRNGQQIDTLSDFEVKTAVNGKYFAIIEADGCRFSTDTLELFKYPNVSPQINGTVSVCTGDTATMDAGPGYVDYLWTTGETTQVIQTTVPGTYFVTVSDMNGCTGIDWTEVTNKIKPFANITGAQEFCEGESTTLMVSMFAQNVLWSTGETTTSIEVFSSGTYQVTITGSNGCYDIDTAIVVERIIPPPNISGVLAICSGESTTLDAGLGFSLYNWSHGPTSRMVTINTAGTYSVTVTDNLGCTAEATVDLIENDKPDPLVTGATLFCSGTSNILDAGGPFETYLWSNGETTQSISVNQSGLYSVTVTSPAGCTGTSQLNVTAQPSPNPQISGTLNICDGETTTLNAGNNFFTYLWNDGSSQQTLIANQSGTYFVTVTNSIGCAGVDSVTVLVEPTPTPDIMGILAICEGEATLLETEAGFANYLWSDGSTGTSLNVTAGGNYSVTVTSQAGCSGSNTVTVVESPNPEPDITGDLQICEGETATLDAGSGFTEYLWSEGSIGNSISVATSGQYSVTVSNLAGCTGTDQVSVTVNPNPTPTIEGVLSFCQGTTSLLSVPGSYTGYQWSNGNSGPSITVDQAASFSVTVTDTNGCTGEAQVTTNLLGLVEPAISSSPPVVCPGQSTQLFASGGTDYLWIAGANLLSDPTIPNPTTTLETSQIFSVEVSNACNSEVISIELSVAQPQGEAGPDINVLLGREVTLTASGGIRYTWNGPSGLSCTDCAAPKTTPNSSGFYFVQIEDKNGCKILDSLFVNVFDDLEEVLDLANTITPNRDGFNDVLVIKGLESFDNNSMTIYNRWGDQIFQEDNYKNSFDGTYNGKLLPPGTYYYILQLWPGDRVVKSTLTILHDQ